MEMNNMMKTQLKYSLAPLFALCGLVACEPVNDTEAPDLSAKEFVADLNAQMDEAGPTIKRGPLGTVYLYQSRHRNARRHGQ